MKNNTKAKSLGKNITESHEREVKKKKAMIIYYTHGVSSVILKQFPSEAQTTSILSSSLELQKLSELLCEKHEAVGSCSLFLLHIQYPVFLTLSLLFVHC